MTAATRVVDAQLVAYRARDLDAFLGFYAAGVVIKMGDGTVVMDGVDAMRAQYSFLAQSPDLHLVIAIRIAIGEFVIDEEEIDGIVFDGVTQPHQHLVTIYRVRDEKITDVTFLYPPE